MHVLRVTAGAIAIFVIATNLALAQHSAPSPFPVERGSAPAPPQSNPPSQAAPPQGVAAGGIDFGQWRSAETATYAEAFKTQLAAREGGRDGPAIQADLEANGFACDHGVRLDCRIEIGEGQCQQDWYVVVDDTGVHPGYEKACVSTRAS